jgi:hypothetical protein
VYSQAVCEVTSSATQQQASAVTSHLTAWLQGFISVLKRSRKAGDYAGGQVQVWGTCDGLQQCPAHLERILSTTSAGKDWDELA